jgi:type IV pilus assembly protein PilA
MPWSRPWADRVRQRGFTLIEMMAVLAVIAILAMIAIPSQLDRIVKEQVLEGIKLAELATKRVDVYWAATGKLPEKNQTLDLPAADKIVNARVSSVTVDQGAVHIVFGNQASGSLQGKTLSLLPAVVDDAPAVPITWICAGSAVPAKMSTKGENRTSIGKDKLPMRCQ